MTGARTGGRRLLCLAALAAAAVGTFLLRLRQERVLYGFVVPGSLLHSFLSIGRRSASESDAGEPAAAGARRCARPADAARAVKVQDGTIRDVVVMLSPTPLPHCFDRCALVGSSDMLSGQGLGAEIDGHDTVIRVNRMPTEAFHPDFGSRTDVLFTGPRAEGRDMFTLHEARFKYFGQPPQVAACAFNTTAGCPFTSLVWKGADGFEHKALWDEVWPKEQPGLRLEASAFALGFQSDEVNTFAYQLLHLPPPARPSNGLHAIVTFGLICNSLDMYGFSGTGTADKHYVDGRRHHLDVEHRLVQWLVPQRRARVASEWRPWLQALEERSARWQFRG